MYIWKPRVRGKWLEKPNYICKGIEHEDSAEHGQWTDMIGHELLRKGILWRAPNSTLECSRQCSQELARAHFISL